VALAGPHHFGGLLKQVKASGFPARGSAVLALHCTTSLPLLSSVAFLFPSNIPNLLASNHRADESTRCH